MRKKVAEHGELKEGDRKVIPLDQGVEVALFCRNGTLYALENLCPHEGGPIGEGGVDKDGVVTCPWHEWTFEVETGKCLNMPGCDLKRFQVIHEEDGIYIEEEI